MEGPDRPIWFAGDLDDPWVVAIAGALPRQTRCLHCPDELPETWPIDGPSPGVLVLHRPSLNATDAQRLARLRARPEPTPRVILCVGPHARYADLERWARLVDAVIPEATAAETVARHALAIDRRARPAGVRPRVAVVSGIYELRTTLADACRSGGYVPEAASDWSDAASGVIAIWDVPVLEAEWPAKLARRSSRSPVIALLGFADRTTVALAREHGASACLDLPCEVVDLLMTLDRVTIGRIGDGGHEVPPAPLGKNWIAKAPRSHR